MEFYDYIFEGREGTTDLKKMYAQFNKMYFGGSLPSIKLRWSGKLKTAVGKASVSYVGKKIRRNRFNVYMQEIPVSDIEIDFSSLRIGISTMFDLLVKDIKAVMLHEMAHIKLYTQKKISGHHDTPEFVGLINKLMSQSGLDIPYKESEFKRSKKVKGREGFIILLHMSDGRKGIATFSIKLITEKWLLWAKNIVSITARSAKLTRVDFYKVNHPVIVEYPAKRSFRGLSWTIIDEEIFRDIEKKGKQFGYADKQGGRMSPHTVGIKDRDINPVPVDLNKKGEVTNYNEVLKSNRR